jgi:predicted DNA-binding ribbon-helix-helix protein
MIEEENNLNQTQKRSVLLSGHRTSISLEMAFWLKLKEICERQGKSINQQITEIDNKRLTKPNKNLSSAIRVYVLEETSQGLEQAYDR